MPIKGRLQGIDLCIADLVAALNAVNIPTVASCCGHGKIPGTVIMEDGRWLLVAKDRDEATRILEAFHAGKTTLIPQRLNHETQP